jgi:hypothetical protein
MDGMDRGTFGGLHMYKAVEWLEADNPTNLPSQETVTTDEDDGARFVCVSVRKCRLYQSQKCPHAQAKTMCNLLGAITIVQNPPSQSLLHPI